MTNQDAAKQAALLLYRQAYQDFGTRHTGFVSDHTKHGPVVYDRLKKDLENAVQALADFEEGKALRLAVDRLLPGWVDIDLSAYIRNAPPMQSFLSNDRGEWEEYLWGLNHPELTQELITDILDDQEWTTT